MSRQVFFPYPNNKPSGFSTATRVGNMVFVSGQVAADENGNLVGKGDARAQADQCFRNVAAALEAAGATLDDLTKITCFLVKLEDYPAYAAARLAVFPENGPASSTVMNTHLVSPDYLVEVEAIAVVE
jgi:enamine deaminase RidA (YjgF/YER057c/UK114 family)